MVEGRLRAKIFCMEQNTFIHAHEAALAGLPAGVRNDQALVHLFAPQKERAFENGRGAQSAEAGGAQVDNGKGFKPSPNEIRTISGEQHRHQVANKRGCTVCHSRPLLLYVSGFAICGLISLECATGSNFDLVLAAIGDYAFLKPLKNR